MAGLENDPATRRVKSDQRLVDPAIDFDPVIGRCDDQSVSIGDPVVFERKVDTLPGHRLVSAPGLPDPLRVIVEIPLPRWPTIGSEVHRAGAFGRGR